MLEYSAQDVIDVFSSSPNLNASVKGFLKREVAKGDPAEKFAKKLRDVFSSKNEDRIQSFVSKSMEEAEPYLFAVGGYAHVNLVTAISNFIVEEYAEGFNETYDSDGTTITVKDEKKFKEIAGKALVDIKAALKDQDIPTTPFMMNVVMNAIFEDPVIEHVIPIAAGMNA